MPRVNLRRTVRELRRFGRWLRRDFPRAPRFESYAYRQDWVNRKDFEIVRAAEAEGRLPHFEPFFPRPLPRIIWIYWAQGEAQAPHVVKRCMQSWRAKNPDWDLRILDTATADALVDLSDVPQDLPHRFRANVLRLRLLRQHGGLWTDATTFCHRPLNDWLPLHAMSGFFSLADPGQDRWLANWFVASEPEGALISAWEQQYSAYIRSIDRQPEKYFMLTYAFQWRVRQDPELAAAWRRVSRLPATPTLFLMSAITGRMPLYIVERTVAAGLPVSKLSWKVKRDEVEIDAILNSVDGKPARA